MPKKRETSSMMEAAENYYAYSGIQDEILQFSFKDLNFQDYSGMKQIRQFLRGGQYFQEAIDKVYLVNFKYSYVVGVSEAGYYETPEEDNVLLQTMLKQEEEKQTMMIDRIEGNAELLAEDDDLTAEQKAQVESILQGAEQTRTYLGKIRAEVQTPLKYKTKKNDKTCRIVEN